MPEASHDSDHSDIPPLPSRPGQVPTGEADPSEQSDFFWIAEDRLARRLTGTLRAASRTAVTDELTQLGLRVIEVSPTSSRPSRRSLSAWDVEAFNQQFALLTESGMPVEQGLALVSQDMPRSRLRTATRRIVAQLSSGKELAEAFAAERRAFPARYAEIVDAGIKSGNLPAVLANLSRHWTMQRRLSNTLRRAIAYPTILLIVMLIVAMIHAKAVQPVLEEFTGVPFFSLVYDETEVLDLVSLASQLLLWIGELAPWIMLGLMILILGYLVWRLFFHHLLLPRAISSPLLAIPLVGGCIRLTLAAQWCDALAVNLAAGMTLPEAIRGAAQSTQSTLLIHDSEQLAREIESGKDPATLHLPLAAVPAMAVGLIGKSDGRYLADVIRVLAKNYEEQATHRIMLMDLMLQPALLTVIGGMIFITTITVLMPLMEMLDMSLNSII